MNAAPVLPWLLGVMALLLAGAAVLLLGGGASARMRGRVRLATGIDSRPVVEAGPNIRVATRDERRPLQRLAELFGYNAELPPAHAASVPFVAAAMGFVGTVVFWRAGIAFGTLAGGLAAVVAALAVMRFLLQRKTRLYREALFRQVPDAISLVLRAVRAGLPVTEAIRSVAREVPSPSRDEFARVVGEAALGVPLETTLWHLFDRTQLREYAFFAVTLGLQGQTGGNLSETLENLADLVRRRVALVSKARALAAEARASAAVLAGLPFATGALLFLVNPDYMGELFTDPRGSNFLLTFAVLLSCGMLTIRWLIQRSARD
jgi:tight adherence protein B